MSTAPTSSNMFATSEVVEGPTLTAESARAQLTQHLKQTTGLIRTFDLLVLAIGWLVALLGLWLLGGIVDHWLYPLPPLMRWLIWLTVVIGSLWLVWQRLIPLLWRRINPIYAAQQIEQLLPEFNNGLISWLELQSLPDHGVPKGVMAALSYRAVRFLGGQDPSSTVDTWPLIKLVGTSLMLTVGIAVYAMLSPKSLLESGRRMICPWLDLAVPTRTQILQVLPGNTQLTQGSPLKVEVHVRGLRSQDQVQLQYSTLDGQFVNQQVQLEPVVEALQYTGQLDPGSPGLEQDLQYWIHAGDSLSGPYQVKLIPLPTIAMQRVRVEYPSYTRLTPEDLPAGVNVEALEGSQLHVTAASNQPLDRARLVINPEVDSAGAITRAGEYLEMKVDQYALKGSCTLSLPMKSFCLRGYNSTGQSNVHPVVRPLRVYSDVPPEIILVGPESRTVKVGPRSRLNLEIRATDPDFGLSKVAVELRLNQNLPLSKTLLDVPVTATQTVGSRVLTLPVNLASLKVKPGDRIEIVAIANDNRHDPITQQPSSNQQNSLPLTLEVVAAEQAEIPPELQRPNPQAAEPKQSDNGSGSTNSAQPKNNGSGSSKDGNQGGASPNDENQSGDQSPEDSSSSGQQKGSEKGSGQQENGDSGGQSGSGSGGTGSSTKDNAKEDGSNASSGSGQSNSESPENQSNSGASGPSEQSGNSGNDSRGGSASNSNQSNNFGADGGSGSIDNSSPGGNAKSASDKGATDSSGGSSSGSSSIEGSSPSSSNSGAEQNQSTPSAQQQARDQETMKRIEEFLKNQQSDTNGQAGESSDNQQNQDASQGGQSTENGQAPHSPDPGSQSTDPGSSDSQSGDSKSQSKDAQSNQATSRSQEGTSKEQTGSQQPSNDQQRQSGGQSSQPMPNQESEGQSDNNSGSQSDKQSADQSAEKPDKQSKDQSSSQSGNQSPGQSESQSGKQANNQPGQSGQSSQSSQSSQSGQAGQAGSGSSAGGGKQSGRSNGPGSGPGSGESDEGEFKSSVPDQTTDLLLDYLKRQRQQPDPDLLKELNWTASDLNEFLERYQSARDLTSQARPMKDSQTELQRLNVQGSDKAVIGTGGQDDQFRQQLDSGSRVRPPERLRKQIEEFQKALQRGRP